MKWIEVKPISQRNPVLVGLIGTVLVTCVVLAAFEYNRLPFIKNTNDYSAYFAEAGGIKVGSQVRISGMGVGRVSEVRLDGTKVRVGFTVRKGIELGTERKRQSRQKRFSARRCLSSRRAAKAGCRAPFRWNAPPHRMTCRMRWVT